MGSSWFSFLVKTGKNGEAEIASGEIRVRDEKRVLGEGLWDIGMSTKQDYELPVFGILKIMWSACMDVVGGLVTRLPGGRGMLMGAFCGPRAPGAPRLSLCVECIGCGGSPAPRARSLLPCGKAACPCAGVSWHPTILSTQMAPKSFRIFGTANCHLEIGKVF